MTQRTNESSGSPSGEGRANPGAVDIAHDVKEIAGEAAGQARNLAQSQVALRKDRAVDAIGSVAQALRETGGRLASQKDSSATHYVARAADGLDRVSQYLTAHDLSDVVHDVEGFARREPAIFLGGAFVAGLIGTRFLKSSAAAGKDGGTAKGHGNGANGNGANGSNGRDGNEGRDSKPRSSQSGTAPRLAESGAGNPSRVGSDTSSRPTLPTGTEAQKGSSSGGEAHRPQSAAGGEAHRYSGSTSGSSVPGGMISGSPSMGSKSPTKTPGGAQGSSPQGTPGGSSQGSQGGGSQGKA